MIDYFPTSDFILILEKRERFFNFLHYDHSFLCSTATGRSSNNSSTFRDIVEAKKHRSKFDINYVQIFRSCFSEKEQNAILQYIHRQKLRTYRLVPSQNVRVHTTPSGTGELF